MLTQSFQGTTALLHMINHDHSQKGWEIQGIKHVEMKEQNGNKSTRTSNDGLKEHLPTPFGSKKALRTFQHAGDGDISTIGWKLSYVNIGVIVFFQLISNIYRSSYNVILMHESPQH